MRQKTKKEMFKSDLRTLREIATKQALVSIYVDQNKNLFFETDGRKRRSKRYKAGQKFRAKHQAINYVNAARKIYQAWKYLGINCVEAGKIYQSIVKSKIDFFKKQDLNLKLTGNEIDWPAMLIETPKAARFKNKDNFYHSLYSLKISAA